LSRLFKVALVLQILIKGEPVTEGHNLEFLWPIAPEVKKYKAAASRYLGHLLGHEGDGSLFALLKQLGIDPFG
jgi:insulysin